MRILALWVLLLSTELTSWAELLKSSLSRFGAAATFFWALAKSDLFFSFAFKACCQRNYLPVKGEAQHRSQGVLRPTCFIKQRCPQPNKSWPWQLEVREACSITKSLSVSLLTLCCQRYTPYTLKLFVMRPDFFFVCLPSFWNLLSCACGLIRDQLCSGPTHNRPLVPFFFFYPNANAGNSRLKHNEVEELL